MSPEKVTAEFKKLVDNNCCYLWGAEGSPVLTTTPAEIIKKEQNAALTVKENRRNAARVMRFVAKLIEEGKNLANALFFDCSGMVIFVLTMFGLFIGDATADMLFDLGTHIDPKHAREGDLAFKSSDGKRKTHVGYIGAGGKVYECKGRDYGAVVSDITEWQFAARYTWFENLTLNRKLKVGAKDMKGEDIRNVQRALCSRGFSCKVAASGEEAVYTENTKQAVTRFQKAAKLNVVSYGVVAKKTAEALGIKWVK